MMKLSCISLLIIFLIGVCSTSVLSAPVDKITICHGQVCPEGSVHGNLPMTLEINENALQSHLDHGDTIGACVPCDGDECHVGCESDEDCDGFKICNTDTGECATPEESCEDVVCDDGFACVHGQCFAVVIGDGDDGQNGSQGQDGVDGVDGGSCTVITVDDCAVINCDDGTNALVCNGHDGASCTVEELDSRAVITCSDGTSVVVGSTNFDDDNDGVTNDIDQCPGTPNGFLVDEVGCMLVQEQPPPPNSGECDPGMDLFGGDQEGHFCGICGSGCALSFAMLFIGLAFLRKRGV